MNQFFATFPAGTFEIIVRQLKGFMLEEIKIIEHDDSSVSFQSSLSIERLIEVRYFTNIYMVVVDRKNLSLLLKGKYFRLLLLKDGRPHPLEDHKRKQLEVKLAQDFNIKTNTRLSKNNFYLIERSSGQNLLTFKLSRAKFKRESRAPGELRPELAHILCLAAGIKAKHVLLDMFAGYGSIPYEAVRGFGCKRVIAVDNQKLPNRHMHPFIEWHEADARRLNFVLDNTVDRVVTDPPWGIYNTKLEKLDDFYRDFGEELMRILKPAGVAVVLSGYNQINKHLSQLKLLRRWPVLISGKKAVICKYQKPT